MNDSSASPSQTRPITAPRPMRSPTVPPPMRLGAFDVEQVRVAHESHFAAAIARHPLFRQIVGRLVVPDPKDERRRLMAESLRLSPAMAPDAHRIAQQAREILGISGELELYQRSGPENAAMHLVAAPILLEIHGSLLPRLDGGALLALFGHELGHYLAHGPTNPHAAASGIPRGLVDDRGWDASLSLLSMMRELTADRVALLACQDLGALLRLMLVTVSGLAVGELSYDTDAYLAQCKDLIEQDLASGAVVHGSSHPEHGLRVYAAWLFSETRVYKQLTGRGPGTRELAEVDEIIARCFGATERAVHDPIQAGDVPREFLECALAAAVLVAHADGDFGEDERVLIEQVFSSELPDWQAYLDEEIAVERFLETAAVLAPSAHEIGPPLLHLLLEVVAADDEIHGEEISMVLEIGRYLGLRELFARGLRVMLARHGVSLSLESLTPPENPLPARRQDVDEALQGFIAGVLRRGETTSTLRRLLRLLGTEQRAAEHLTRLEHAIGGSRIQVAPAIADAALDQRLVLVPTKRSEVAAASAPVPASRVALINALRRLREQLVSGDGRSPSVRLRTLRKGRAFDLMALDRVSIGMAERVMVQVRGGKAVRLVDAGDAGRHGQANSAAAELIDLARADNQVAEETGAHDLYVGYPFLKGNVAGYFVRGPLVLYPVELKRDGAGAGGFRLDPRRDELPVANQSLIRLIFNKRGFVFSDELSDELEALAGAPDGGPEAVRKRLAEVGLVASDGSESLLPFKELRDEELSDEDGLAIEEIAILGLFPQSSSDLLQDYDGLLQDLTKPSADVGELLAAASALLPDTLAETSVQGDQSTARDWSPVIQADPSQRAVIAEARRNGATVIDGPPGTGKSQVIVNLVAEALQRGERVAVVCEKRAALDVVYQRLSGLGFSKAVAVVHDVHEDRKALYAHVAGRLENTGRIPFSADEAAKVRAEYAAVSSTLSERATLLQMSPEGLGLTIGELMAFASQSSAPAVASVTGLDRLPHDGLRALLDGASALRPLVDLWNPASVWRAVVNGRTRRSLADATPSKVEELTQQLAAAVAAARRFDDLRGSLPAGVSAAQVVATRKALAVARDSRTIRNDETDRRMFGAIAALASTEPERLRETAKARQAWDESKTALLKLEHPIEIDAGPAMTAALAVLARWHGHWYRIFILAWWQAKRQFREELAKLWPAKAGAVITSVLIQDLSDRIVASRAWKTIGGIFDHLGIGAALPTTAPQLEPTISRVASMADSLRELGAARTALQAAGAWLPEGQLSGESLAQWDGVVDERLALLEAHDALASAVEPLRQWFPQLDQLPQGSALATLHQDWKRDGARLLEADQLIAKAAAVLPAMPKFLDQAADAWRELSPAAWRAGMSEAWAKAWVHRLEQDLPLLAQLGGRLDDSESERLAARLRELEVERRELEIERTLASLDSAPLLQIKAAAKNARRTPEQKLREELLKESRKQRMLMPLRTFVRRYSPQGLLDSVPVWLLSPETMAILFPRQALFDLVVFDEASQCTVEAGLPVLMRAKRVVIAGDEKQMPPSSYFALGSTDEDEALAGTVEADDTHDALRDLLTAESLLSLARPRVAHTGLAWHYRCRDESLIAFSNHAMYDGGLLTIPSTAGSTAKAALHWVPVEDGVYASGENAPEAARVVDVVNELLARSPRPTIGVVTFNLKQRKAVLDAVDARCAADDLFRERWGEASTASLDERPFVKNLDQVQGDERDVIVFSLGHAPQARYRGGQATGETYVPARFGPLGQRGGERRLNVAISRAKEACYLIASFEPAQLTVASSKHLGPRLFKNFLEFAHHQHHGRRLEAERVLDLVRGTAAAAHAATKTRLPIEGFAPLKTQLALALEAAGIPYESDIGSSGFRVPLAVLNPEDPTRFALALLLQDGTGSADPFDLSVHRPGVLGMRGWKVLSISAASWYRRPSEVLQEIEALVPGCVGAAHSDIYKAHRAAMARAAAPPPAKANPAPRRVTAAKAAVKEAAGDDGAPAEPAGIVVEVAERTSSAPIPDLPAWAMAIADELFRTALLHLERHGLLSESDLIGIVGGPRRARAFSVQLDGLLDGLPFHIETTIVSGTKSYRKVSRR